MREIYCILKRTHSVETKIYLCFELYKHKIECWCTNTRWTQSCKSCGKDIAQLKVISHQHWLFFHCQLQWKLTSKTAVSEFGVMHLKQYEINHGNNWHFIKCKILHVNCRLKRYFGAKSYKTHLALYKSKRFRYRSINIVWNSCYELFVSYLLWIT